MLCCAFLCLQWRGNFSLWLLVSCVSCFHNRFLFLPIIFSLFCMNYLHITVTVPGSYTGVHVFHIFRIKVSEGISSNRETKFAKAKKKKKQKTLLAAYILRIEVPHVIRSNRKTKFAKTQSSCSWAVTNSAPPRPLHVLHTSHYCIFPLVIIRFVGWSVPVCRTL